MPKPLGKLCIFIGLGNSALTLTIFIVRAFGGHALKSSQINSLLHIVRAAVHYEMLLAFRSIVSKISLFSVI